MILQEFTSQNRPPRPLPMSALHLGQKCLNSLKAFMQKGARQHPHQLHKATMNPHATQALIPLLDSTLVTTDASQDGQTTLTGLSSLKSTMPTGMVQRSLLLIPKVHVLELLAFLILMITVVELDEEVLNNQVQFPGIE